MRTALFSRYTAQTLPSCPTVIRGKSPPASIATGAVKFWPLSVEQEMLAVTKPRPKLQEVVGVGVIGVKLRQTEYTWSCMVADRLVRSAAMCS